MDAFYDFILWVVLTSTCQRTCSCEKMSRARLLLDIIETDHPKIRPVFMNKKPTLVYVWCHSASSTDPRVRCASTSGVSRVTDAVHNYSSCPVVFGVDDLASTRPSRHLLCFHWIRHYGRNNMLNHDSHDLFRSRWFYMYERSELCWWSTGFVTSWKVSHYVVHTTLIILTPVRG